MWEWYRIKFFRFSKYNSKDIEKDYHFPKGKPLEIRLKDILESEVDEKFYLSQKIVERFKYNNSLDSNVIGSTLEERTSYGHKDVVYNPDQPIDFVRCYLGTYFPRSYVW